MGTLAIISWVVVLLVGLIRYVGYKHVINRAETGTFDFEQFPVLAEMVESGQVVTCYYQGAALLGLAMVSFMPVFGVGPHPSENILVLLLMVLQLPAVTWLILSIPTRQLITHPICWCVYFMIFYIIQTLMGNSYA